MPTGCTLWQEVGLMRGGRRFREVLLSLAAGAAMLAACPAEAETPPVLTTVFPCSGQTGQSTEVAVTGSQLQGVQTLHLGIPGGLCERLGPDRFRLTIPAGTMPGHYDLWAAGDNGVSAPRTFLVGSLSEQLEVEPNDTTAAATSIPLNGAIGGKIDKAGDIDVFCFDGRAGQRVVIECQAERIDSRLRAVLEVFDSRGRRLAVNRGYFGIDPLIDFHVSADGSYLVKIQDLIAAGSAEHYYRLEIDTGPRVAFSLPNVIERGRAAQVALFGWNLPGAEPAVMGDLSALDRIEVEIPVSLSHASWPLPARLQPAQGVLAGGTFPFHFPGSQAPVLIGVTDAPVIADRGGNHSPESAQDLSVPCDVSGQLASGDECDWFALSARRGEVYYLEALGQRISAPVDLQLSVCDATPGSEGSRPRKLAQFHDEVRGSGGPFRTAHLDPSGRWVCPTDGRYLIAVRNLTGGLASDPRRTYRLSVRREEPEFQLIAVPRSSGPAGLNVPRGGREVFDLLAMRRRGFDGTICVAARDLPEGLDCPDICLGPGVERAVGVISADHGAMAVLGELKLEGTADFAGVTIRQPVVGGTVVRSGTPTSWGRIVSKNPLAVVSEAPVRILANGHEKLEHQLYGKLPVKHSPGGIVDVAVQVERRDGGHQAPVKLSGVGLPDLIDNQTAVIPAGERDGYLSFYLPPSLPAGRYSLVVRAETTVPNAAQKPEAVTVFSNPVTIDVQSAAFIVDVDPFAVTRARRGEVIQIAYSATRLNGFIGKMHTELAAPGCITDVPGLLGRGETFVGQTDKGSLQIEINDDAPLGRQAFLRLLTVGVLEDEPIAQGSRFLTLEIVE